MQNFRQDFNALTTFDEYFIGYKDFMKYCEYLGIPEKEVFLVNEGDLTPEEKIAIAKNFGIERIFLTTVTNVGRIHSERIKLITKPDKAFASFEYKYISTFARNYLGEAFVLITSSSIPNIYIISKKTIERLRDEHNFGV